MHAVTQKALNVNNTMLEIPIVHSLQRTVLGLIWRSWND